MNYRKYLQIAIPLFLICLLFMGCSPTPENEPGRATPEDQAANQTAIEDITDGSIADDEIVSRDGQFPILLIGVEEPPLGDVFRTIRLGVEDAVSTINENGGIDGTALDLRVRIISPESEDQVADVIGTLLHEAPLLLLMAAPVSQEMYEALDGQSVPVLYFGLGGERLVHSDAGRDNLFWLVPPPDVQMAFVLEQLRSRWSRIGPSSDSPEMITAFLTWDAGGPKTFTQSLDQYLEDRGFQIGVSRSFPASPNSTVTNALLESVAANVGLIYTDTFAFGPAVILNDLQSLGVSDFYVLSGSVWSMDGVADEYLLNTPFSGKFYVPRPVVWWSEEDHPAIQRALAITDSLGRTAVDRNLGYLLALGAVDIAGHVIQLAVEARGSDQIFGRDIYAQLEDLEGYSVFDGLFVAGYTERNRIPNELQLWVYDGSTGWEAIGRMVPAPELTVETE